MSALYKDFKKFSQDQDEEDDAPARKQAIGKQDVLREYEAFKQENAPEEDVDYEFGKSVDAFMPSLERLGTGIIESVYKDGEFVGDETVESIGDVLSGIVQQLPGAGEILGLDAENARLPGHIIDAMKERYGGINEIKRTAMEDPAGMLFDLSGLITGGGSLAIKGASNLAKATKNIPAVRHLTQATEAATRAAASTAGVIADPSTLLRQASNMAPAEMLHRGALSIKSPDGRVRARELSDIAYKEGLGTSDFNIAKLDRLKQATVKKRNKVIEDIKGGIDISEELKVGLAQSRAKLADPVKNPGVAKKDLDAFDKTTDTALQRLFDEHGGSLTPPQTQAFKSANQGKARKSFGDDRPSGEMAAHKAMASGAREALEQRKPELGGINQRWNDLRELQDALDPATTAAESANRGIIDFGVRSSATPITSPQTATLLGMGAKVLQNLAGSTAMLLKTLRKGNIPWTTAKAVLVNAGRTEREVAQIEQELQRLIAAEESTNVPQ